MAQKNHPKGFRLGINQTYSTKWFEKDQDKYSDLIIQDAAIRQFLARIFPNILDINIERSHSSDLAFLDDSLKKKVLTKIKVVVTSIPEANELLLSPYSRLILSKKGLAKTKKRIKINDYENKINELLANTLGLKNFEIQIIEQNKLSAQLIGIELQNAVLTAQRTSTIRMKPILKSVLKNIQQNHEPFKGLQIELAGRAPSSPMATKESVVFGSVPKQSLISKIDYCAFGIPTKLGILGVKIWLHFE